ncbi:MAG: hypothetical protein QGH15_19085 [Kiritimatiellia bacterium]|nr:hypothetical protein [Kiritimatiellia bacterium]
MSDENNKRTQQTPEQKRGMICGFIGVAFGITMSNIVGSVLSGQSGLIRITASVVAASILSGIGCLIAFRFVK